VPFLAPSFVNMSALLFPSNPTCAGIHFIVICFCVFCLLCSILIAILLCRSPSIAFISIWHAVLESVSMTALFSSYWNMKFVAISIAFSSTDEIGRSFSILYLPSKALASQYTLIIELSIPSAWFSSVRCPSVRSDVVWCHCSFFSHFQCPLGRSRLPGFAASIRESLFPPRPLPQQDV
jgi:hypothetical protein